MDPRSHIVAPADHTLAVRHTDTAATDSDDSPVVHWPEPSPLESWWKAVMRPGRDQGRAATRSLRPSAKARAACTSAASG